MYCVFCGQITKPTGFDKFMVPIGFICTNPDCVNPKKEWTLSEDKDNQNWNIRHIRTLETQIEEQQEKIITLEQQMNVYAQLLQAYSNKLIDLENRIGS